jgi:hypothetical protein
MKGSSAVLDTVPLNDSVFKIDLLLSRDFWKKSSSAVLDTVPLNGTVFNIYLPLSRRGFWEKGSSAVLYNTVALNGTVFNIYLPLSRRGFWKKCSFALFDATAKILDNKSLTCVKRCQHFFFGFVKGIVYRIFSDSPVPRHIPPGSPDHFLLKFTRIYKENDIEGQNGLSFPT